MRSPFRPTITHGVVHLSDGRRYDVPVTLVCPEFTLDQAKEWIEAGDVPELAKAKRAWSTSTSTPVTGRCSPEPRRAGPGPGRLRRRVRRARQDQGLWSPNDPGCSVRRVHRSTPGEVFTMRKPLIGVAVALMLVGALMLVLGGGAAGLWIGVITVGIAVVVLELYRNRQGHHA